MRITARAAGALLIAAVTLPAVAGAQSRALAPAIRAWVKDHAFSGTVLVRRGGTTLFHESFGLADRAFGVPVTNDTRFRIASITKTFTATLVLQLYQEGKIDLRAPIKVYLPEYRGEGAERVTVHQLLTHTSGIENFDRVKTYEEAVTKGIPAYQLPHSTDEILSVYASGPLVHEPGKVFDYNNADYIILGKIIEHVAGQPFDSVLAQRILRPLGMRATGMLYAGNIVSKLAPTYFRPNEKAPLTNDLPVYPQNWYAAGGMYATAVDLATFADALYGGTLIGRAALDRMVTPALEEYGYGLWVRSDSIGGRERRLTQRPGSIMGANTLLMRYLDEGLTIVILANTNVADTDALGYFIGRIALR